MRQMLFFSTILITSSLMLANPLPNKADNEKTKPEAKSAANTKSVKAATTATTADSKIFDKLNLSVKIRGNMRILQVAAEMYATKKAGSYPKNIKDLLPFLPGGDYKIDGTAGKLPENPCDKKQISYLDDSRYNTAGLIQEAKLSKAEPTGMKAGQIGYCSVDNGHSYAIFGTDPDGNAVHNQNGTILLLSNQ